MWPFSCSIITLTLSPAKSALADNTAQENLTPNQNPFLNELHYQGHSGPSSSVIIILLLLFVVKAKYS